MNPKVSIIMGSTSDLPVMEKACKFLDEMQVPFEVNALSAHRTPDAVETFARTAKERGLRVIIAGAGMDLELLLKWHGSCSAWRYRGFYYSACYRCTHQGHARWSRCHVLNHSDASRHTCGNGRRKRCTECSNPRRRDARS